MICLLIGYAFGLIQTGYLMGKIYKIDIREQGSGNAGTTNALRVLGWKIGLVTFLIDMLKCIGAVLLVRFIFQENALVQLLAIYTGLGVTLGHNFPFYMKFKGGKGIAVMGALIIITSVFTNPMLTLIPLVVFVSTVVLTRYVSLGSLQIAVLFLGLIIFYGQMGDIGLGEWNLIELYAVVFVLVLLAWYKHWENIKRLLSGTENRFGEKKNKMKPIRVGD